MYSPFVIDDNTPCWQVDLWEFFLTEDDELNYENFRNKLVMFLKSRQIGFSFACTYLVSALGLSLEKSHAILATANKAWIAEIFASYMEDALPILLEGLGGRNMILKDLGLPKNSFSFDKTTLKYRLTEKSVVQLLGIDTMSDKNRGKGNVDLVIVDEAGYIQNPSVINMVIQPMLNFANGSRIYGSTTNGDNWFKAAYEQVLVDKVKDPDKYHALSFNLYTSGVYREEKCDEILMDAYKSHIQANPDLLAEDVCTMLAQEYFCHFTTLGKEAKMFPRFSSNPDLYVTSFARRPKRVNEMGTEQMLSYSDTKEFSVGLGIDYGGVSDPMAMEFIALNRMGQFIVFDELYMENTGIEEAVEELRKKEVQWGIQPFAYFIDRSTGNRQVALTKNEHIRISTEFMKCGLMVTLVKPMKKFVRIDLVNEYCVVYDHMVNPFTLETPGARLYISDLCVNLIKQMSNLKLKNSKTTDKKESEQYISRQLRNMKKDHAVDALLYGVSEFSGINVNQGDASLKLDMGSLKYPNRILNRNYEKSYFKV